MSVFYTPQKALFCQTAGEPINGLHPFCNADASPSEATGVDLREGDPSLPGEESVPVETRERLEV